MCETADQSAEPLSTPNITTVNYTLEWPHLENPSNTTFVGSTQIDICRCPRPDLAPQNDKEPGHIYTRYQCVGPEVRFKTPKEELWVLQTPQGPINMLRPAWEEERKRREAIHDDTDPVVYEDHNFLFLTGPCPRGRYQAYATQKWLETLSQAARQHVSCLSLLVQPYEEDCSIYASRRAYSELAEYILHCLPGFKMLCLDIWDDKMDLGKAASEFVVLFHRNDVKIVVRCGWRKDDIKSCDSPGAFLEAMSMIVNTRGRQKLHGSVEESLLSKDIEKEKNGYDIDKGNAHDRERAGDEGDDRDETPESLKSNELATPTVVEDYSSDEDWTDATLSPISPLDGQDRNWQML